MVPELLSIFGVFSVNSFGLCVALAAVTATFVLATSFERQGIASTSAEKYIIAATVSGIIGARLWFVGEEYIADPSVDVWELMLSPAGFTFYGGFVFAAGVLSVLAWREGIRFSTFADAVGPALAIGYAIGRLGCQLSGDGDYGIPTTSWWGMSYSQGVVPTPVGVEVFPTPMYESMWCVAIFFFLRWAETQKVFRVPFRRFGMYLALAASERFVIEFIRVNVRMAFNLSEAQLVSLVLMLLGSSCILLSFWFAPEDSPVEQEAPHPS